MMPCLVAFGLTPEAELEWHLAANQAAAEHEPDVESPRIGTATERLVIGQRPTEVKVETDPFVVPTAMGYAPAILIRPHGSPLAKHLLIGARSLARPLEQARERHHTLVGLTIRLRKLGAARTSEYSVEVV